MKPQRAPHKAARQPAWRRRFLQAGLAALGAGLLPLQPARASALSQAKGAAMQWKNWSGIVSCTPKQIATPASEAEIQQICKSANLLRCAGSGHSFTPLAASDAVLLSLDKMSGLLEVDSKNRLVRVKGGTRLFQLSRALDEHKLALPNLPDIDMQTICGAIATATHGAGATLPALHAQVQGFSLINGLGEKVRVDSGGTQLLQAGRVALGALGVISEVTLQVEPAFNLQRKVWLKPLEEMLKDAPQLAQKHRHFEFYYLPHTGYAAAIAHDLYQGQDVLMPPSQDEQMLADLKRLRDWAGNFPNMRRWLAQKLIDPKLEEHAKNRSYKLLSNARPTRFNESECHVPRKHGIDCLREIIARLEQRNDVFFPLEFRFVKGDEAWLSPFYQRDSCSIAVHALAGEPYEYLVTELGPIFRKYQARPHWGKLHNFTPKELAALYPRWDDFLLLRKSMDPQGKFLTPYLKTLFGIA
ncbi:D-arabinono-1,4-lactone oxidase [Massilia sp. W12]|uniref:D-arabinono-1,4-lactone oxidase n=1 Tax=Massilia sp. W12 TaxID=3126507 RepID=UPI0030D21FC0